jgi:hypothetical protein
MRTSDFLMSSLHRMLTEHMKEGLFVCQHISSHEFYVTDGEFCHCDLHQKLFGKFNFGLFWPFIIPIIHDAPIIYHHFPQKQLM